MLLRLSRISFWLAAAVAALALLAPGGHETLLTAVSGLACLLALGLWRSAAKQAAHPSALPSLPPVAPVLDPSSLLDAAALLVRRAHEAGSFEAALHAVAQVLRSELGAQTVAVHAVHGLDDTHARIGDLIAAQPGFRTVERRVRLDAGPLAQALRSGREAGELPGAAAVPVTRDGQVVAAIALGGIELPIEPKALAGLLELARLTLSPMAGPTPRASVPTRRVDDRPHRPPAPGALQRAGRGRRVHPLHANVLVVEDTVVQPEATTRMLRRLGCRVSVASGMLDGLNALRRTQFDVILVDMQMSGMGAAEGLKRLRHGGEAAFGFVSARDTPAIALSVPGLPGDGERFRELGFDDFLAKPFRQGQMLAMLNRHLRLRAPAESHDSAPGRVDAASAVLDAGALARLTELDPKGENKLLERVLQAFQASVARLRPQLDAARQSDDRSGIRLVVHTLKSSSASIGALRLSQLCAQIETTIRLEAAADLGADLDALNGALDGALRAIDTLLKERA